ncbi:MAG: hypothetical protein Ct9H90mP24_5180 [Methanobacteriota archaeon]|nr:MAG: hypothetical protein Ct9H90mP24_5180 [Euryarchaeota archaeon]
MSGVHGDRVLVTGALGQIGTDLVQALRREHGKKLGNRIGYQGIRWPLID